MGLWVNFPLELFVRISLSLSLVEALLNNLKSPSVCKKLQIVYFRLLFKIASEIYKHSRFPTKEQKTICQQTKSVSTALARQLSWLHLYTFTFIVKLMYFPILSMLFFFKKLTRLLVQTLLAQKLSSLLYFSGKIYKDVRVCWKQKKD